MAEKTILVCDACGKPAVETVTIKAARGNFVKDLCAAHVNELVAGARKPRRGRPKAVAAGSAPQEDGSEEAHRSQDDGSEAPRPPAEEGRLGSGRPRPRSRQHVDAGTRAFQDAGADAVAQRAPTAPLARP